MINVVVVVVVAAVVVVVAVAVAVVVAVECSLSLARYFLSKAYCRIVPNSPSLPPHPTPPHLKTMPC